MKIVSVFLCQRCRELWREILVKFSVLRFPRLGCATENFTKVSRQKRCEKRKISRKFHSAGGAVLKIYSSPQNSPQTPSRPFGPSAPSPRRPPFLGFSINPPPPRPVLQEPAREHSKAPLLRTWYLDSVLSLNELQEKTPWVDSPCYGAKFYTPPPPHP